MECRILANALYQPATFSERQLEVSPIAKCGASKRNWSRAEEVPVDSREVDRVYSEMTFAALSTSL